MTPNEEKEREAFEKWVNENHNAEYISRNRFLRWMDDANNYVLPETSWAWAAWKAGRAALRAESEPVGYKLVPIQPTKEMRNAGNKAIHSINTEPGRGLCDSAFYAYQAMLDAAPQTLPIVEREEPEGIKDTGEDQFI